MVMKEKTIWRLWQDINSWEDDAFRISDVLRNKLWAYEQRLAQHGKNILLPEELKDLDRETDAYLSILLRRLDRYLTYLVGVKKSRPSALSSVVKYSSRTEIDGLPFPIAQLISTEPDVHKYHARLCRALLHVFSYPGMTTCRCEMESERTTGLLLYSFFDWFATVSYSSSLNGLFNSIRIFERNSTPQWTTNGLAPIVFFSIPLKFMNTEIQFGEFLADGRFKGREVPDFMVPLVTSIQPGLNALLLHEIEKWKTSRKTTQELFIMPDWLFIHGIVYDAVETQVYTFTPKIIECDAGGVPSKWEFACLLTYAFYPRLYDNRSCFRRLNSAITLLEIQRHTTEISKVLKELPSDSIKYDLTALCRSAIAVEERREKTLLDIFDVDEKEDISDDERWERATECLLKLMDRTGLYSPLNEQGPLTEWVFVDTPWNLPQYDLGSFLSRFMNNWRPTSGLLSLPEDWLKPTLIDISDDDSDCQPAWIFFQTEPKFQLYISMSPHKGSFTTLSEKDLLLRHFDPESFAPDFYLATPPRKHRPDPIFGLQISVNDLSMSTLHSLEHFEGIVQYMCHEIDAKSAMSSLFKCIPGCWLRCDTESRFPSALATNPGPTDFSLLLHPIQTVPMLEDLTPDVSLRSTILNPALVIGIQGHSPWPDELSCSPFTSSLRLKTKSEALQRLAKAIEPSLKVHLINWQLRFEQGLTPSRELPPWFMLFGIIYDAQEVNIVAHIPVVDDASRYSFTSCIVDTISFPLATPSSKVSEPWFLDRFRVALALMSLQKHAFRMAGLWECVAWPEDLVFWEEILEREYIGPVLTPSERGYMVEPHPMAELYREIHGSDVTIDDNTVSVDAINDEIENTNGDVNEKHENNSVDVAEDIHLHEHSEQGNGYSADQRCRPDASLDDSDSGLRGPRQEVQQPGEIQDVHIVREMCIASGMPSQSEVEIRISPWRKQIEYWRIGVVPYSHVE